MQRALDDACQASRMAWARLHPDIARRERAVRKKNAETLRTWKHKNDGTPQTHAHAADYGAGRRNEGALARLYRTGAIDAEQLASAAEIAAVVERIRRDVAVKTASLETRIDTPGWRHETIHDEKLGQVRREMAYTRWRDQLSHPAAVLEMIVGEWAFDGGPVRSARSPVGFSIVAVRHGIHHRKAKRLLLDALDLWPEILGGVFKIVDTQELDRAHARLAA